jgi:hypothetical protein
MKKMQYSYLPSGSSASGDTTKSKTQQAISVQKTGTTPPNEETVARLNAIAREYPFCAYIKTKDTRML